MFWEYLMLYIALPNSFIEETQSTLQIKLGMCMQLCKKTSRFVCPITITKEFTTLQRNFNSIDLNLVCSDNI